MNLNLPYCCYETTHESGVFYRGKGKTALVLTGKYTGSGTRYKLARYHFKSGWTTKVLSTYATEAEAYEAEALLVPVECLMNPFVLNSCAGGQKGVFKKHPTLLASINSAEKRIKTAEKKAKAALVKQKTKDKMALLKRQAKGIK